MSESNISSISKKYNIIKIIIDILLFRLKISDIQTSIRVSKRIKYISDLYEKFDISSDSNNLINNIYKIKIQDILLSIKINNKYVKNESDKINIEYLNNILLNNTNISPVFISLIKEVKERMF